MDPSMTSGVHILTDEEQSIWGNKSTQSQPQINVIHNTINPICYDCHASSDPDRISTNIATSLRTTFGLAVLKYTCRNCDTVREMSMNMHQRESA